MLGEVKDESSETHPGIRLLDASAFRTVAQAVRFLPAQLKPEKNNVPAAQSSEAAKEPRAL